MRTTIIYHKASEKTDCPDGIAAAWVCQRAYPGANVVGDWYDSGCQPETMGYGIQDRVILCDFSYPYLAMAGLADQCGELIVLDHHATRADDIGQLAGRILGGYSPTDCGATFAWRHFFPDEPPPWFLSHVRNRDIGANGYYDGDCPDSRAITTAMSAARVGLSQGEVFKYFDELRDRSEAELIADGQLLLAVDDALAAEIAHGPSRLIAVGQYTAPLIEIEDKSAERLLSWIGTLACKRFNDFPFVALTAGDPTKISLRSRGEFDVGELAKALGGGGHKNAAGFTIAATPGESPLTTK